MVDEFARFELFLRRETTRLLEERMKESLISGSSSLDPASLAGSYQTLSTKSSPRPSDHIEILLKEVTPRKLAKVAMMRKEVVAALITPLRLNHLW